MKLNWNWTYRSYIGIPMFVAGLLMFLAKPYVNAGWWLVSAWLVISGGVLIILDLVNWRLNRPKLPAIMMIVLLEIGVMFILSLSLTSTKLMDFILLDFSRLSLFQGTVVGLAITLLGLGLGTDTLKTWSKTG